MAVVAACRVVQHRRTARGHLTMEFRVLGSVEVIEDGRRLPVPPGRPLALLALLLIHADRFVSTDRILDDLWGDEPPGSGAKSVAFHVARLRDALEPGRGRGRPSGIILTEPSGYRLRVESDQIDAVRFERAAWEGRNRLRDDPEAARTWFVDALALWRSSPYGDVADEPFARPEVARLEELRLAVLEDRLEADLELGREAAVVGELETLVAEQPLRERLRGQLMVALYRLGRQVEALRAYGDGARLLSEELGVDPGPELRQLEGRILRQDPGLEAPARRGRARNPYKGLRAFGEEDRADFYGREALVARLVGRLGQVGRAGRFLAVVGASGSGKSSAVRAGLLPALRAGGLPGSERWRIACMLPGARPFRALAAALDEIAPTPAAGLAVPLERDGDVAGAIAEVASGGAEVLVVIDQFEELYSLVDDDGERARFIDGLIAALAAREGRLLVVVTLRADFFARPLLDPGLGELVRTGTEVVTPLARDELERAIVSPAGTVGVELEPGLAQEVIADVARQPGELPLLQYALTELFDRSDGRRLTREGYLAIGGVLGALGRRADDVYAALDPVGREIARQVFLRLVVSSEGGEPTAQRVARSALDDLVDDRRRLDQVLDEFGRGRLLAFDRDAVTGEATVQVAHEALLARWPRLAGWIDDAREDLWTRRRLADAAAEWIRSGRDPGFLLSGSRLDLFAAWAASTDLRLDLTARDLVEASLAERRRVEDDATARAAHERALERRATTRLRVLVAVLAAAAIVATSLSVVVYGQGEAAREHGAIAAARELAAASIGNLETDPQLSLLLAWQAADATAGRDYITEEAMDALHWALGASQVAYPAGGGPVAVRAGPGGPRGVMLLAPDRLMALAAGAIHRRLSAEECRTYLHRATCPRPPAGPTSAVTGIYTSSGVVPVERLSSRSLAGSRVDALSQLPVSLAPLVSTFEHETGIDVVEAAGPSADLSARLTSGDLPDVAIVSRPALVGELARAGRLVDLSGFVDVARLRATAGDYLVRLGTVGADGTWPAAAGPLYGATFATEVESLVWYPRAAFERAGYGVPATYQELVELTERMVAHGRTPWCLGVAGSGVGAAGLVEDLVLHASGPVQYDAWAAGRAQFQDRAVRNAFVEFGRLMFGDRHVVGGVSSATRTPWDLAPWPMFLDAPQCWLYEGGGSTRLSWPAVASDELAAFPFPALDPSFTDEVRGRAYMVIVFHDRPEVRELVGSLLGSGPSATVATSLVPLGIRLVASPAPSAPTDDVEGIEAALQARAIRAGTFRVSASDLMPAPVATAFAQGMVTYLSWRQVGLDPVLDDIQASWGRTP